MTKYFKIIDADNFGSDYPNELQLAWVDSKGKASIAFFNAESAEVMLIALNKAYKISDTSPRYHFAAPVSYELQGGFEP